MFTEVLKRLGLDGVTSGVGDGRWIDRPGGAEVISLNPADGKPLGPVLTASRADYDRVIESSQKAFGQWRSMPAPGRGEIVRRLAAALREAKEDLGLLVTLEAGKIRSEGLGEVQEMIDMCDFAVGLSR